MQGVFQEGIVSSAKQGLQTLRLFFKNQQFLMPSHRILFSLKR
jgi:hypothetical protein